MNEKRKGIRHFVSAAVFLAIAAGIFVLCTYLFRTTEDNARLNLVSFYNEKPDTLDMVVVGGSGVYRYWDPMCAYEDSGMTSFSYSCASMSGLMLQYAIEEVLSSQDPDLIIIDGRRFVTRQIEERRDTIRFFLDSIDLSVNRFKAVAKFCSTYNLSFKDAVSFYLDLCLYHNNTSALSNKLNWELIDNRYDQLDHFYIKGYGMSGMVETFQTPSEKITGMTEGSPLGPKTDAEFHKFMEYLTNLDADVLLLFTPSQVTKEYMKEYIEMERIAAEYGIPTWNGNRYYDEMELNFETDFYDKKHTNINGSQKFTKYFLSYLEEHYDFPDHRTAGDRPEWDEDLEIYHEMTEETWETYKANFNF